jgi:hypothetical protein
MSPQSVEMRQVGNSKVTLLTDLRAMEFARLTAGSVAAKSVNECWREIEHRGALKWRPLKNSHVYMGSDRATADRSH